MVEPISVKPVQGEFRKWSKVGSVRLSRSGKILIFEIDGSTYFVYAEALIDVTAGYQDRAEVLK